MRIRELAWLCALLCCACKQIDVVAVRDAVQKPMPDARMPDMPLADAQITDARVPTTDAQVGDARVPDGPKPCPYETQAPPGGSAGVTAASAARLGYAICSCAGIASSDALTTDAFDGAAGRYTTGEVGGDVGVDDEMSVETSSSLLGRVVVAGASGLRLGDDVQLDVGDGLAVGGPLLGALASARITGDAAIAGRIDLAALTVSSVLLQPQGSERNVSGTSAIGAIHVGEVSVPAPCNCEAAGLFDTRAFVAAQAPQAMLLPSITSTAGDRCSAYRLAEGEVPRIQISVRSPAVIYAPGDLHVTGDVVVDSEAGAALDLFIAGDVRIDGRIALGTGAGQGPVRVYVGGSGTLQLSSGGELHGVLYAPNAELVLSAPLRVDGALFVRRVAASAALTVHYDRNLARDRD